MTRDEARALGAGATVRFREKGISRFARLLSATGSKYAVVGYPGTEKTAKKPYAEIEVWPPAPVDPGTKTLARRGR